jgi:hypothetical protein
MQNRRGQLANVDRVVVHGKFVYAVDIVEPDFFGGLYALPQLNGESPGQVFLTWGEIEILNNITMYNTTSVEVRKLYGSCFAFSCCASLTEACTSSTAQQGDDPSVVGSCSNNNALGALVSVCSSNMNSQCLCSSDGGFCNIFGECVCALGFSGTQCEIRDSSNTTAPLIVVRSNDALILGLAIGIPVAVVIGVAIALAIAIFHRRSAAAYTKQSNQEIKMKMMNPSHQTRSE